MEQMKMMKQNLMSCINGQMSNLQNVDTKELGEAIDMIKDLSEAIYYCTITEAMEGKEKEDKKEHYYYMEPLHYTREMDRPMGRMYYNDYARYTDGESEGGRNNRNYTEYAMNGGNSSSGNSGSRNFTEREYTIPMRDAREGRSPMSRKMYMETKEMKADKATAMKELEKYVQELTHDMVEMIADASPDEKHYLEKRMNALAAKIGQTNV